MPNKNNYVLLIGNGFDLAHDMKTSYIDYANWLKEQISKDIIKILFLEIPNDLLQDNIYENYKAGGVWKTLGNPDFIGEAFKSKDYKIILKWINTYPHKLNYFLGSELLCDLYLKQDVNWSDVEQFYFRKLRNITESKKYLEEPNIVIKLNNELEYIRKNLIEYLQTIKIPKSFEIEEFLRSEIANCEHLLVVDFNYTETISQYVPNFDDEQQVISIHGTLTMNDIIFGYGNDQDEEYQKLKSLADNNILENMKTVEYIMHDSYQKMINKLDDMLDFEVKIIGHSLGLTDKTLLNEIFEHKNCKKIELYKRGDKSGNVRKSDFKRKAISITRIMNNEAIVREKVVNYSKSKTFP